MAIIYSDNGLVVQVMSQNRYCLAVDENIGNNAKKLKTISFQENEFENDVCKFPPFNPGLNVLILRFPLQHHSVGCK